MSNPQIVRAAQAGSTTLVARCTDSGADDGLPVELTCTSIGELKIATALVLDPTNLATSALQTSIGATAHTDAGAIEMALGLLATETTLDDVSTALGSIDGSTQSAAASLVSLLAQVRPFLTFVPIDYSGGNQTVTTALGLTMRGFNITTAGNLKVDCAGVTGGTYAVAVGTNLLAGVTLIYQTGSTAAGSVVY